MGNVVTIPSRVAALSLDDMAQLQRLLVAYAAELTDRGYPRLGEKLADVIQMAKDDIKPPEARDRRRDPGPLQWMKCCRCGDRTKGRQWWNCDTGFGICPPCVQRQRDRGASAEEILELYGQKGIHWGEA